MQQNEIRINCVPEKVDIGLEDCISMPYVSHRVSFKDLEDCVAIQHDACPNIKSPLL